MVWDIMIVWTFMFLLAGAASVDIKYPEPVCAVEGSTVTLPCSFTPLKSFAQDGKEVQLKILGVRWCVNHLICQGSTPSVFDSTSITTNSRYQYLGDLKGNCTLKIRDIRMIDNTTFRFRMEANYNQGHYTGKSGVRVTVAEVPQMRITSSHDAAQLGQGQTVTLHCTAVHCTSHLLEVTWFKDGHPHPQSGPTLQLGPLTAKDSGNYTCALKTNKKTPSPPYTVCVKEEEEKKDAGVGGKQPLIFGVVFGILLPLLTLILVLFIIIRKRSAAAAVGGEVDERHYDNIDNILRPAEQQGGECQEEAVEDISYVSLQFIRNSSRPVVKEADTVLYSSVANRD
ncbi:hypothetical protein PAMP_002477 [Pampus punctatissimus]